MEIQKRKMNILWLNKWALIREKKEEMRIINDNIRKVKDRKHTLVKYIQTAAILKKVYDVFSQVREAKLLEIKINFAVFMFGLGLKRFLRKKAPTREERSKRVMKRVFTYQGNNFFQLKIDEAKKELLKFLKM